MDLSRVEATKSSLRLKKGRGVGPVRAIMTCARAVKVGRACDAKISHLMVMPEADRFGLFGLFSHSRTPGN